MNAGPGRVGVGVAVETVEVPAGTAMAGFAARLSPSTGVHDPVTARALVIEDIGVVALDVCALHEDTCRLIEQRSTLDHVIVAATHTHSGPCISFGRVGRHQPKVHDAAVEAALAALGRAAAAQRPAVASWLSATGAGIAKDRRHLERTIDPPVQAIVFSEPGEADPGSVVAVLASYPCHPVVLDATNTDITGDYVHFMRAAVEDEWDAPVVFLTGACGDINTGHSAEASYGSRRGAGRTFAEAEGCGRAIAEKILTAPRHAVELSGGVAYATIPVQIAFARLEPEKVASDIATWEAQREDAPAGTRMLLDLWLDWARAWEPVAAAASWQGRVSRLRIGSWDLVAVPGEPFLGVAEALRTGRGDLVVAGYSDGVPGYFPMAADHADGGYEVCDAHRYYAMPAPFAEGSAERLIAAGRQLLEG